MLVPSLPLWEPPLYIMFPFRAFSARDLMDPAWQIAVCYGRAPSTRLRRIQSTLQAGSRKRPAGRMCGASSKQFGRADQAVDGSRALGL